MLVLAVPTWSWFPNEGIWAAPRPEKQSLTRGSWQRGSPCWAALLQRETSTKLVGGGILRAMTPQDIKITGKWSPVLLSKNSARANLK